MIHFNDPDYAKQRAEVKPLTLEEEEVVASILNRVCDPILGIEHPHTHLIQRLIWNYENLSRVGCFEQCKDCHKGYISKDQKCSVCEGRGYVKSNQNIEPPVLICEQYKSK